MIRSLLFILFPPNINHATILCCVLANSWFFPKIALFEIFFLFLWNSASIQIPFLQIFWKLKHFNIQNNNSTNIFLIITICEQTQISGNGNNNSHFQRARNHSTAIIYYIRFIYMLLWCNEFSTRTYWSNVRKCLA